MVLQVLVVGAALFYRRPFAFIFGGQGAKPGAGDVAAPAAERGRAGRRADRRGDERRAGWVPQTPIRSWSRPRTEPAPRPGQAAQGGQEPGAAPPSPPPASGGEPSRGGGQRSLPLASRVRGRITFEPVPLPLPADIDAGEFHRFLPAVTWRPLEQGVAQTIEHFRRAHRDGLIDADRILSEGPAPAASLPDL